MEDWTILVISLSVISGILLLASCLATARYGYRRVRKGTRGTSGSETSTSASPLNSSGWLSGMLPRAQPGPNGTAQHMNGWFALDGPSRDGWSRSDSRPPSYVSTPGQEDEAEGMRDPHFSRAQRAARRAKGFLRRTKGDQSTHILAGAKSKKKPRSSRTTEAAQAEEDAGQEMWSEAVAPEEPRS